MTTGADCTTYELRTDAVNEINTYLLEGVSRVVLDIGADDLADHRVLAHEHGGGTAKRETDLGHLVGPHVVTLRDTTKRGQQRYHLQRTRQFPVPASEFKAHR